jgi:hypothetical protein
MIRRVLGNGDVAADSQVIRPAVAKAVKVLVMENKL